MTKNKKQLNETLKEEILRYIADSIEIDFYEKIVELYKEKERENEEQAPFKTRGEIVKEDLDNFFDYLGLDLSDWEKIKDFEIDGKNEDGNYLQDLITEYADGEVSVYNNAIWSAAPILSSYIEDALEELGVEGVGIKERGIIGLLQTGQFLFYERYGRNACECLENYIKEQEKK